MELQAAVQLAPFRNRVVRLSAEDEAAVAPLLDTLAAEWGGELAIGSYPVSCTTSYGMPVCAGTLLCGSCQRYKHRVWLAVDVCILRCSSQLLRGLLAYMGCRCQPKMRQQWHPCWTHWQQSGAGKWRLARTRCVAMGDGICAQGNVN
jgi:hypothetical protein